MKSIIKKIKAKESDMRASAPLTFAFLGDSVTQGCFECYVDLNGKIQTEFDYGNAYSTKLRRMLASLFPNVQINIINSGISGDNAAGGRKRLERDVLKHEPDLVVVGFALNDAFVGGRAGIDKYKEDLRYIINGIKERGAECIVLTPNMMCTSVSPHLKDKPCADLAAELAKVQNGGVLDLYAEAEREVAAECGATVCDVYSKWIAMRDAGANITELLSNKLNHPTRELHEMTAMMLLDCILN
jgi:lysophospholipase L1-like esterase